MFRLTPRFFSTKVLTLKNGKELISVGIIRERLFGPDTIEEALKVVDSITSRHKSVRVLVGLNDKEFELIDKSVSSRNQLRGRFMSPLVVMCRQSSLNVEPIGRKLTATSSKLSSAAFFNPLEFYKVLWIIMSKSWSLVRAPSARRYLERSIPRFTESYFSEGSECMASKIARTVHLGPETHIIAVTPMENTFEVVERLEAHGLLNQPLNDLEVRLRELESEGAGLWVPVFILYVLFPLMTVYGGVRYLMGTKLGELGHYETQGIALGTWVRDSRRD